MRAHDSRQDIPVQESTFSHVSVQELPVICLACRCEGHRGPYSIRSTPEHGRMFVQSRQEPCRYVLCNARAQVSFLCSINRVR